MEAASLLTRSEVKALLHHSDPDLVRFLLDMVNLTAGEWTILKMREFDELTVEAVAEELDVSTRKVDYFSKKVMDKLTACWGAKPWVKAIVKAGA